MADTVINCHSDKDSIVGAIHSAEIAGHKSTLMYGDGDTAEKIVEIIKDNLMNNKINLKKNFYDIEEIK